MRDIISSYGRVVRILHTTSLRWRFPILRNLLRLAKISIYSMLTELNYGNNSTINP